MKIVRALTAAALALVATAAIQVATTSGASASVRIADCTNCWYVVVD